jgi:uncharacterized protein (TIGR02284 family)
MDELAVLTECERGEDVAKAAYASALDEDLAPRIRRIVERQFRGVVQNHNRVKGLRERWSQRAA